MELIRPPLVGVIVVGHNSAAWLPTCLTTLLKPTQRCRTNIHYVDNASDDDSVSVASQFARVGVLRNGRNLGFAAANNLAIELALQGGADYVFLVNPDTATPHGLLDRLVDFMERWPQYGIIGPLQGQYHRPPDDEHQPNDWTRVALAAGERHALGADLPSLAGHRDPGTPRAPQTLEHAYVQGAALFARASLLRTIGTFDHGYHSFYEEVDLCRRARLAGARVALLTDCWISHVGGEASPNSGYRRRQMLRNKYYFLLTDIQLPYRTMSRIAGPWFLRDLAGRGVGGTAPSGLALLELAAALCWLARKIPAIRRRRRLDHQLASATARRSAASPDQASGGRG